MIEWLREDFRQTIASSAVIPGRLPEEGLAQEALRCTGPNGTSVDRRPRRTKSARFVAGSSPDWIGLDLFPLTSGTFPVA